MRRPPRSPRLLSLLLPAMLLAAPAGLRAWDYELHRLVNELALASLPAEVPSFLQGPEVRERLAFLAGEPDRLRNNPDPLLRHVNGPDHYFDLEDLQPLGLKTADLSPFRAEFLVQLARARQAKPGAGPNLGDPADNDRTRWMPGLLPWRMAEDYARIVSAWSYLKTFEAHGGTPGEIRHARENLVFYLGILGHFVADAAQPLHTTKHFNGWAGENPAGYTTHRTFHAWIDGGYLRKTGFDREALFREIRPAQPVWGGGPVPKDPVFGRAMAYVEAQWPHVETLYRMEKAGELSGRGEAGLRGRPLLLQQLRTGAQMLGDLWYSAWQQAGPDTYLQSQLARRRLEAATPDDGAK
ncbi:MAG: hypothetical protein ACKO3N_12340 [Verrucomicrobiota bacterium]